MTTISSGSQGGTTCATSCSITPFGLSTVKFIFTGSFQSGSSADQNTATTIFVPSGSTATNHHPFDVASANSSSAQNLRDVINNSGSLHGLTSVVSASVKALIGTGANIVELSASNNGNFGTSFMGPGTSSAELTPLSHGSQPYGKWFDVEGSFFPLGLINSTRNG